MSFKVNPFTGNFDEVGSGSGGSASWTSPQATEAGLVAGSDGDAVVTKDTDMIWVYDGTTSRWISVGLEQAAGIGSTPNARGYSLILTNVASNRTERQLQLQPANATNPGIITTGSQTFAGDKTFTGVIYADGTIDVTSGTLSIGSVNATIINLGNASSVINFNGTVNNNNVTNLNVADQLITINDGGGAGSASGAGFEIEEAGIITSYFKTSGDRNDFIFTMPNKAGIITLPGQATNDSVALLATSQTLTNKTINADNNTITNIDNNEIKALAAIDASKIANGTVSNTEYQYLDGVTSPIQTQLNGKQDTLTFTAPLINTANVVEFNGAIGTNKFSIKDASDATKLLAFDLSSLTTGVTVTLTPLSTANTVFNIRPNVDATANIITQNGTSGQIFIGSDTSIGGSNSGIQYSSATAANRGQIRLGSYINATSVAGVTTATSRSGTVGVNAAVLAGQEYSKWTAQAGATTAGSLPISGNWSFMANTVNSLTVTSDYRIQLTNLAGTLGTRLFLGSEGALQLPFYTTGVAQFDASGNVSSGTLTASTITNVPAGNISATTVQAAINELDTEKQPTGNYITALTGDVVATGPGSVSSTIQANVVDDSKFRTSVGLSVVGRFSNTTGNVADIIAGVDGYVLRRSATSLGFGYLVDANIDAAAAIARTKIASGTANHVVINDASGVLSSEAQLSNLRGGTGLNTSAAANGTLLIGNGTGFSLSTLTAGAGISIGNGSGTISIASTITQYTDEMAQDAVGTILTDSSSIDFTYNDAGNTITAVVLPAGVDHNSLANLTTGDAHTQYALLVGRSGGQTLTGGTASGNNLILRSTSNATKGQVQFDETTASTSSTTGAVVVTGGVGIGGRINAAGAIQSNTSLVLEDPGAGTNTVTIQSPTLAASYTLTLPVDDGTASQVLQTDGSGVLSWTTVSSAALIFGSRGTPRDIVAATGITSGASHMSTTSTDQVIFIQGSGGAVTITANPQIQAHTVVGARMTLVGRSDTNTVTISNGTGLELNGNITLSAASVLYLMWDGTVWFEVSRNN